MPRQFCLWHWHHLVVLPLPRLLCFKRTRRTQSCNLAKHGVKRCETSVKRTAENLPLENLGQVERVPSVKPSRESGEESNHRTLSPKADSSYVWQVWDVFISTIFICTVTYQKYQDCKGLLHVRFAKRESFFRRVLTCPYAKSAFAGLQCILAASKFLKRLRLPQVNRHCLAHFVLSPIPTIPFLFSM